MKNLDLATILIYRKRIIDIAIILLALFIGYSLYNTQIKGVGALTASKENEYKKNNVLNVISENEKKVSRYRKFVNNKDIYSVMNIISGLTKENGIKIISFRPADERAFPFYTQYLYNLKVSAPDYVSLGKFVSLLENSPEVFVVDTLNISPISSGGENRRKEAGFDGVNGDLVISTFVLK